MMTPPSDPAFAAQQSGSNSPTPVPILRLRDIGRDFMIGDQTVSALANINIDIFPGELVAIVGQSGSGKSTLLNILGCLDVPTTGQYLVAGADTAGLDHNQQAELRRDNFGFVFQRYHLLSHLTAVDNILLPAIYADAPLSEKKTRAKNLISRLGISDRSDHKPNQLSGGQQQRVSIARALINGGSVVFADEPTGALDSRTGEEVMQILHELNREGHTIVIVTHDHNVAAHTDRIIQLHDGRIISDKPNQRRDAIAGEESVQSAPPSTGTHSITASHKGKPEQRAGKPASNYAAEATATTGDRARNGMSRWMESFHSAWASITTHRLRSFLTMLGIIIGITSVVTIVAVGEGTQNSILNQIQNASIKTVSIFPGESYDDPASATITTLNKRDLQALNELPFVDSASPVLSYGIEVQRLNKKAFSQITGISDSHLSVFNFKILSGTGITKRHIDSQAQVVVLDEAAKEAFFSDVSNPIGQILVLNTLPMVVVGVVKKPTLFGLDSRPMPGLFIPYTTALQRFDNRDYFSRIVVKLGPDLEGIDANQDIEALLTRRHNTKDFFLETIDTLADTFKDSTLKLKIMISSIALISLLVGGIGVMNIMLVSVSERYQEIGIRIAVGARRSDILGQFLIESVLLCTFGGVLGILLSYLIGKALTLYSAHIALQYSFWVVSVACSSAAITGVTFGLIPARTAARLNPVQALARE